MLYFPDRPDPALLEALADLRRYLAQYPPEPGERGCVDAALQLIETRMLHDTAIRSAVVENTTDALFVVEEANGDLEWTYVNQGFERITGLGADAAIGNSLASTPGSERISARCREVLETGICTSFDEKRDGPASKFEVQTRLTPMRGTDGRCVAIVGISRDVTALRNAERMLRKQNRRLQNVLDSISDGFITVDRDWRITFLNSRAEQIIGVPRAVAVGTTFWEALPDLSTDKVRSSIETAGLRHGSLSAETVVTDSNRWLAIRTFPSQEGVAIYIQDISDRKLAEHALTQGLERTQASLDGVVNAMAFAVEMRDPYTGGHQRRVSALSCAIARQMGMPLAQIETLRIAGLLHDIGKISIPAEILNRPGRLSDPELIIVRTHAQISYEILKEIEFAAPVAQIALQHHERLDGSGYPQGLQGDTIILEARILAVADVVEAMASHRPYRAALGVECALQEVISNRGTRYDARAVDACLTAFTESGFDFEQLMQSEIARRHHGPIL